MEIKCPIHDSEMVIESYSETEYFSKEFAGPEQLSYIDGRGTKTFSAPVMLETKLQFTVNYMCSYGCQFTCQQNEIHIQNLNRGISRQSRGYS